MRDIQVGDKVLITHADVDELDLSEQAHYKSFIGTTATIIALSITSTTRIELNIPIYQNESPTSYWDANEYKLLPTIQLGI